MKRELRTIIKIDEEACNGCGLCVTACHEGALALVDGKARLMHEHYCDGLGDCLPACPMGAIAFEQRVADAYDEAAVLAAQRAALKTTGHEGESNDGPLPCGCPGIMQRSFDSGFQASASNRPIEREKPASHLGQWPVQIKLVSPEAPYFAGADLLIAADCTAFAYGAFHQDFMEGKVTLIGCPKLDAADYSDKLTEIIAGNDIASVTVTRMEVPCCGGIERAAKTAVARSGKDIPVLIETISIDGRLL